MESEEIKPPEMLIEDPEQGKMLENNNSDENIKMKLNIPLGTGV